MWLICTNERDCFVLAAAPEEAGGRMPAAPRLPLLSAGPRPLLRLVHPGGKVREPLVGRGNDNHPVISQPFDVIMFIQKEQS